MKNFLLLAFTSCVMLPFAARAQQTTITPAIVHGFETINVPGRLVQDASGNFYGTDAQGGAYGYGSVYRVGIDGTRTTLVSFDGLTTGCTPLPLTAGPDGNFYGVTQFGASTYFPSSGYGSGTIFKVTPGGVLTILVNLNASAVINAVSNPSIPLTLGPDGSFYGAASGSNSSRTGNGSIFRVSPDGATITALVSYPPEVSTNPPFPASPLLPGANGTFYGVSSSYAGANGEGVILRLNADNTVSTLFTFSGDANGGYPAAFITGTDGNLYGTTDIGGATNQGTFYEITADGVFSTLSSLDVDNPSASFGNYGSNVLATAGNGAAYLFIADKFYHITAGDGPEFLGYSNPVKSNDFVRSALLAPDGNIYATCAYPDVFATGASIIKATTAGAVTTFADLRQGRGQNPEAGLTPDGSGNFYGTTFAGGTNNEGTIFKLAAGGTFTPVIDFNGTNGQGPAAALTPDGQGNFYGTTTQGGAGGSGAVFKLAANGTLTTLISFGYDPVAMASFPGNMPETPLVLAADGNFYGTTRTGGSGNYKHGTIFKVTPTGTASPVLELDGPAGNLVAARDGNLYLTCGDDGLNNGNGTFFEYALATGTLTPLAYFDGTTARSTSSSGLVKLIQGTDGNFYGASPGGGANGLGTVFRVTTGGNVFALATFDGTTNGAFPAGPLFEAADGNFYGVTQTTAYRVTPGGVFTSLFTFPTNGSEGSNPIGALTEAATGDFYGVTEFGPFTGQGLIYEFNPNPNATPTPTPTPTPAPVITSPATATAVEGQAFSYQITTANIIPEDYSAFPLPTGLDCSIGTGLVSGTPATGTAGTYNVNLAASDAFTNVATAALTLTIYPAGASTPTPPPGVTPTPTPGPTPAPPPGVTPTPIPVTPLSLLGLNLTSGGNAGPVTLYISGNGFVNGTTFTLAAAGQPGLAASSVQIVDNGFTAITIFDLTGQPAGVYNLVAANPDGTTATLANAFAVTAGVGPVVNADIIGGNVLVYKKPSTYTIYVTNTGDADAVGVPLYVTFPNYCQFEPLFDIPTPPQPPDLDPPLDFSQIPLTTSSGTNTVLPLIIPRIPAGTFKVLQIRFTPVFDVATQENAAFEISVDVAAPLIAPGTAAVSEARMRRGLSPLLPRYEAAAGGSGGLPPGCLGSLVGTALDCIPIFLPVFTPVSCVGKVATYSLGFIVGKADSGPNTPATNAVSDTQFIAASTALALECAEKAIPGVGTVLSIIQCSIDIVMVNQNCGGGTGGGKKGGKSGGRTGGSLDPNGKYGSDGDGSDAHYLSGSEALRYQVEFENVATATLPAQRVVVTDQLDTAHVDLGTFNFGPISFGDTTLYPPSGVSQYADTVDLRPAVDLLVQVNAGVDPNTGLFTCVFQSLDPATGQPPVDPTRGFLPPDANPPAGTGLIFYTIRPKPGLPTGMAIQNAATVFFDNNPSIDTPTWTNTLDNDAPMSTLKKIAKTSNTSKLKLKLHGSDVGAGVLDYDVYVSEDGGGFQPLLTHQAGPKAIFTATTGHKYAFFSRARDAAGNMEPLKTAAETKVKVVGPDLIGTWNNVTEKTIATGRIKLKGSLNVSNQSPADATTAESTVDFYLSADAKLDDTDKLIGQGVAFPALSANGSATVKLPTFKLPPGTVATGMYIIAVIDPAGNVGETDKTNNTVVYGPLP